ncbi:MAG: GNAT family N-acetyltransferase [Pseudomonadota bacterium]|nr:GNAT family N-acetyltransferase [Pseudomonadota bacterium]
MTTLTIEPVEPGDLPALFVYLDDHLQDNGKNGTPLFQPMARHESFFPAARKAAFATGLATPVGTPHWRRAWIALDASGTIAGHVDVRARPEKATAHRAMLGMGVHRDFRRQGLGKRLLQVAQDWATQEAGLDWLDLEVIATNLPGRALYLGYGFSVTGEIADMFRIDGEAIAYTFMTLALRR